MREEIAQDQDQAAEIWILDTTWYIYPDCIVYTEYTTVTICERFMSAPLCCRAVLDPYSARRAREGPLNLWNSSIR